MQAPFTQVPEAQSVSRVQIYVSHFLLGSLLLQDVHCPYRHVYDIH